MPSTPPRAKEPAPSQLATSDGAPWAWPLPPGRPRRGGALPGGRARREALGLQEAAGAPEAAGWARGKDDDALGDTKWLPMSMPAVAGGMRFPPVVVFPTAGASSLPWLIVPGAPRAFAGPGGGGMVLVPPYVGATRQEQLNMWASLFNPLQQVRPRMSISLGGDDAPAGPGRRARRRPGHHWRRRDGRRRPARCWRAAQGA